LGVGGVRWLVEVPEEGSRFASKGLDICNKEKYAGRLARLRFDFVAGFGEKVSPSDSSRDEAAKSEMAPSSSGDRCDCKGALRGIWGTWRDDV
jgi:hypothetical protein